ncbi:AAA family ATPase [Paraburkholderia sp. SEWSISQ10-3 4]|nr:AAA family ATPase [Paraburkholderia aspalathi]MDN7169896.1 AAA family ATPase [Paraburkholderia sp. SEWSISQ10-3 4]MDQ6499535.1 AAA family ATPase [Paraburkholderia aspalathi]
MIHSLEIQNFMSVRDCQLIDLGVGSAVSDFPERYAETWTGSGQRVPKVVAFFGANAAGKSTVLRALQYLSWFVKDSFQFGAGNSLPFEPFWDNSSEGMPVRLAVEFAGPEKFFPGTQPGISFMSDARCRYMYELNLQLVDGRRTVLREGLYFWPSRAKRRVRLFERNATGDVDAAKEFALGSHRAVLKKILRDNASVIATLAQLDHLPSLALREAAGKFSSNIFLEKLAVNETAMLQYYQANPTMLASVNNDLASIDLGIRSMSIVQGSNGPVATFRHEGLSRDVPLMLESHGTRQFLQIYPYLAHVLQFGGIAVIDELDLAIHPRVLPEILRWFYSKERNPHGAQLWMTCQNASLLENLTKEEIYFCEKDSTGGTSIYSLKDIQGVRRVDNFYRKYMGGTYGAVPTIG